MFFLFLLFKQILPRISLTNIKNENSIDDTNIVIAPKPMNGMNGSQKFPKLKILPAPTKPIFNAVSRTNHILMNNNCKLYFFNYFLNY